MDEFDREDLNKPEVLRLINVFNDSIKQTYPSKIYPSDCITNRKKRAINKNKHERNRFY